MLWDSVFDIKVIDEYYSRSTATGHATVYAKVLYLYVAKYC